MLLRIIVRLILGVIVCVAVAIVYATAQGESTWYFRVNGSVTIDGRAGSGYLHANTQRTVLLLTRSDEEKPETYLVPIAAGKPILDCGEWHPIRFFPNVVGDLNSRCSAVSIKPADQRDPPASKTVVRAPRSIEFATTSGKKVRAVW